MAWWWTLAAGGVGIVLYGVGLVVWLGSGAALGTLVSDTRTGHALVILAAL